MVGRELPDHRKEWWWIWGVRARSISNVLSIMVVLALGVFYSVQDSPFVRGVGWVFVLCSSFLLGKGLFSGMTYSLPQLILEEAAFLLVFFPYFFSPAFNDLSQGLKILFWAVYVSAAGSSLLFYFDEKYKWAEKGLERFLLRLQRQIAEGRIRPSSQATDE